MKKLTVLYDDLCGFCTRCRFWLERQPKFVELEFVAAGSPEARRRFPELEGTTEELVAVSDEGDVYRGSHAWILCLYALRDYREWSFRLSQPALLPLARQAFELLSRNRNTLSRLLRSAPNGEIAAAIQRVVPGPSCGLPSDEVPR